MTEAPQCLSDLGKQCWNGIISGTLNYTERSEATFQAGDWAVLGCVLGLSALVGLFWAWKDRNKSSEEYMMGGGNVSPVPIAMSLATTFFSAITVLGTPVEFYQYGTMFGYFCVTYLVCTILRYLFRAFPTHSF